MNKQLVKQLILFCTRFKNIKENAFNNIDFCERTKRAIFATDNILGDGKHNGVLLSTSCTDLRNCHLQIFTFLSLIFNLF